MELAVLAISLLGVGVPIWIAARTKPLGPYPYRWGLYIGIKTLLMSLVLSLLIITEFSGGPSFGMSTLAAIAVFAALAAVGLIRRARFGVVLFFITYSLLVLPLLLDALYPSQRATQRATQTGGGGLVIVIVASTFYFKKRWQYMTLGGVDKTLPRPDQTNP